MILCGGAWFRASDMNCVGYLFSATRLTPQRNAMFNRFIGSKIFRARYMTLRSVRRKYDQLDTTVLESDASPKVPVILCHGYGAPGTDLVGVGEALVDLLDDAAEQFRFVFPAAPLSPPEMAMYGGRAWWEINMTKLLAASESGTFSDLHDVVPPGIGEATELLVGCVQAVLQEHNNSGPYVLGGFSQGAMLTINAALDSALPVPSLLVQFSGTLLCQSRWQAALTAGRLAETTVLQAHGRQDSILPFSSGEALEKLLKAANVKHQFIAFNGPHTISMDAIMQLAVLLKSIV